MINKENKTMTFNNEISRKLVGTEEWLTYVMWCVMYCGDRTYLVDAHDALIDLIRERNASK